MCDKALNDAKDTIDAKNKEIELGNLAIQHSLDYNADLNTQLKEKEAQLQSPLRNPFIMTAVGLVLGVIAVGLTNK